MDIFIFVQFSPGQVGLKVTQQSLSLFLYERLPLREERPHHHLEDDLGAGGEGRDEEDQEEEFQQEIERKEVQQEVQHQLGDGEDTEDGPVLQPLAIDLDTENLTIYIRKDSDHHLGVFIFDRLEASK